MKPRRIKSHLGVALIGCSIWSIANAQSVATAPTVQAKFVKVYDSDIEGFDLRTVTGGVLLGAREFALLDNETPMVVRVSGDKPMLIGRTGSGPGEYSRPSYIATLGDSLTIIETQGWRLDLFPLAKMRVGKSRTLPAVPNEGFESTRPIVVTAHGVISSLANSDARLKPGTANNGKLVWQSFSGGAPKTLSSVARTGVALEIPVLINGKRFTSATVQPFVIGSLWSGSTAGQGVAVLDVLQAGSSDVVSVTLRQWDATGNEARACKWTERVLPMTSSAYGRATSRLFNSPAVTAKSEDIDRHVTRPSHLPYATRIQLASDGSVWLRTAKQFLGDVDQYIRVDAKDCARRSVVQFDTLVRVLDARGVAVLGTLAIGDATDARMYNVAGVVAAPPKKP